MTATSLRRRLGRARRYSGYVRLLTAPSPRAAYVGWVGEGNLGDTAMHRAHARLLPGMSFPPVPNLGRNRVLDDILRRTELEVDAVCLGGGTLIGNGAFRTTLFQTEALAPRAPRFMIGTGAEDPAFVGRRARTDAKERRLWAKRLRSFEHIRVRGPQSAAYVADLGLDVEVVGDPALALADGFEPPAVSEGRVGLNVGWADDLWGDDNLAVADAFVDLGRLLRERGHEIVVVQTWTGDQAVGRSVAARIGGGVRVVAARSGVDSVIREIGRCEVFVAEKLHAAIFAAIAAVPTVAVEYQPKCRDFQRSIGRDGFCVRSDHLSSGGMADMVEELRAQRAAHSASTARAVALLVERQREHARTILSRLAIPGRVAS